jgi:alanyl-tRNA synthetase
MNIIEEYKKHCELYDIPFHIKESCLSYDDSTLFCPAGMQQFKSSFKNLEYKNKTVANVQRCLRLNDFNSLADGTHFGVFDMMGLFSFRDWKVSDAIDFWMIFLKKINAYPDYVTIHPLMKEWNRYYQYHNVEIREDTECIWSDGDIGGYCTEFYKNGIEIGNIVNPLGTCIDVGFGLERLNSFTNPVEKKDKTGCIIDVINQLIFDGIKPSNTKQGYILRKLLRQLVNLQGHSDHPFFLDEQNRQIKIMEKYKTLAPKNLGKSKEWWFDTHGVDLEFIPNWIH